MASSQDDQVPVCEQIKVVEEKLDRLLELARLQSAAALKISHAAVFCGCSYDVIYDAVQAGQLPAANIGTGKKKKSYLILKSDLLAWLEKNKSGKVLPLRSDLKKKVTTYLPGVG